MQHDIESGCPEFLNVQRRALFRTARTLASSAAAWLIVPT